MKNSLTDVKNHLIAEMERLNDDEFVSNKETLKKEIDKANALSSLAEQIVNIQNSEINAMKTAKDCGLLYVPKEMELKQLPCSAKKGGVKVGPYGEYEY